MGVRKGSEKLRDYQLKKDKLFQSGKFIPFVALKEDGDRVIFRPVTEHDYEQADRVGTPHVLTFGDFHNIAKKSTKGKTFFKDVLCTLEFNDDAEQWEGDCKYCEDEDTSKKLTKFMMWVYVKCYLHRRQNSDQKTPWKQVTVGREQLYLEEVNDFQIWQDGYYMEQSLQAEIDAKDTLTSMDYMVRRHGEPRSSKVRRVLTEGKDRTDINALLNSENEAVLKLSFELPDLEKIATGEVETMNGRGEDKAKTQARFDEKYGDVPLDDDAEEEYTPYDEDDDLPF